MQPKRNPVLIVLGVMIAVLMVVGAVLMSTGGALQPAATGDDGVTSPRETSAAAPAATTAKEAEASQPATPEASEPAEPPSAQPTQPDPEQVRAQEEFMRSLARRDPADPAAWGVPEAPVVIIEWSDYRCPFCSRFNEETLPQLAPYVESGQVRFEFRDLAIFGDESVLAAVGGRAAGQQGKQVEFMHALFAALPNEGHPPVDEATLVAAAEEAGVAHLEAFTEALGSTELRNAVLAETYEAQQMGLGSVPAFVVGTQYVAGAQSAGYFQQVIEVELAKVPR